MLRSVILMAMMLAVAYGQFSGNYKWFNANMGAACGDRPVMRSDEGLFIDGMLNPNRVLGGSPTKPGDHMWMVVLMYNGALRCGGSIIHPRFVLNAAHCTVNTNAALMAFLRVNTRNNQESWAVSRPAAAIVNHPSYSGSTYSNDISIIRLAAAFVFDPVAAPNTRFIGAICLFEGTPADMSPAVSTGWGSTFSGGSVVQALLGNVMPITPLNLVQAQYGTAYFPATMIAAALQGDGLDTCQGDSGGPLSVGSNTATPSDLSKLCQVGIVSWGYGCGGIGIYSRVETYLAWIDATCQAQSLLDPTIVP